MSEACCPATCVCDDWLTAFCDYVSLSHTYCGTTTQFAKARVRDMPTTDIRAEAGVHQTDRQIEISMVENDIESGIGATIVDDDQQEWVIYRVQKIKAFCLLRLWARSIKSCFGLTDRVELLKMVPCETDCGPSVREQLVGRLMAKAVTTSGQVQNRASSVEMRDRVAMRLEKWPGAEMPGAEHRIRTSRGIFKIISYTDGGIFVPFELQLEPADVQC